MPAYGPITLVCTQCGVEREIDITCAQDLDIVEMVRSIGWSVSNDDIDVLYCDKHEPSNTI